MNYKSIINDKGVELQIYAEKATAIIEDISEYLSQDRKTDEEIRLFYYYSEKMNNRVDIIFDYVHRMAQLGKIIECLSGKLIDDDKAHQIHY